MEDDFQDRYDTGLPDTAKIKLNRPEKPASAKVKKKRGRCGCAGCGCLSGILILLILFYLLAPIPNRFLLLGIDRSEPGTMAGRSDTIMLFSLNPLLLNSKVLSIPRDLWVPIPGYGENRINAAHFFAEAQQASEGPDMALETINQNFILDFRYYVRFNLENIPALIDALEGVTIRLPEAMSGYPAGAHLMNGEEALAFLRDRSDGDDFFRIRQGQVFLTAFVLRILNPSSWPSWPSFLAALPNAMDTNIPFWLWPRIGFALALSAATGLETLTIGRDMVTPFTTSEGAQVLLPDWQKIHTYIQSGF